MTQPPKKPVPSTAAATASAVGANPIGPPNPARLSATDRGARLGETLRVHVAILAILCGGICLGCSGSKTDVLAYKINALGNGPNIGGCQVRQGILPCGGVCANTHRDPRNCGACGNVCMPGHECHGGVCAAPSVAVSNAVQDPHQPRGDGWTYLGPQPYLGGRISGIAEVHGQTNQLSVSSPGGGVWLTNTAGTYNQWFEPGNYAFGDYTVNHLEWDVNAPGVLLYAAVNSDLFSTSDSGNHWTNLTGHGGEPPPWMPYEGHTTDPRPFAQLHFDAAHRAILWGRPCDGLYYSLDGTTFSRNLPSMTGAANALDNCIQSITSDWTNGYVWIATMGTTGTDSGHVYRSANPWSALAADTNWVLANANLPMGLNVNAIVSTAWSPPNTFPNNLMAAIYNPSNGDTQTWESADGLTWSLTASQPSSADCGVRNPPGCRLWDPRPLSYTGGNQLLLGDPDALQTTNYASSWGMFSEEPNPDHADFRAFTWDTTIVPNQLWATNDGSGSNANSPVANILNYQFTAGATPPDPATRQVIPTTGINGLPIWQAYFVAGIPSVYSQAGKNLYVGSQDNGMVCSMDGGATWASVLDGDANALVVAPSNSNVAYATGAGTLYSTMSAESSACQTGGAWSVAGHTYGQEYQTQYNLVVRPDNEAEIYYGGYGAVWKSANYGVNFNKLGTFPSSAFVSSIFIDASGNLYAGTIGAGAFFYSASTGNWCNWGFNTQPPPVVISAIAWTPFPGGSGTFWLASTDGLYSSSSGSVCSATWARAAVPLVGYGASAIAVDAFCPEVIYLGDGAFYSFGQHRGGVLASADNGATWTSLTAGLDIHQTGVSALQVERIPPAPGNASRYVYASSYGRGGWQFDLGPNPPCPPVF